MGTLRNSNIAELRKYDDPLNPATSQYDVLHPRMTFDEVFDPASGKKLSEVTFGDGGEWEVYTCTGTADSTAVANLVNNFFNSGAAMTKKIKVVGTMGVAFTSTYYAVSITGTNSRGATCYLDFSECVIPEITTASRDFLMVSNATVKLNVTGLTVTTTRYGVYLSNSENNVFSDCTISSDGSANSYGIYLTKSSKNVIRNCTIKTAYVGVYLSSNCDNNTISNCTINGSAYGVNLSTSSYNVVDNCIVNSSGTYGVFLNISNNNTFTNCTISGSSSNGLYFSSSNNCTYTNCTISGGRGVYGASTCRNNIFFSCAISGSVGEGLFTSSEGMLLLQNCKIVGANYGIYIQSTNTASETKLFNCQIKGATQDISQSSSASNTIKWVILGNSFSKASIIADGIAAITSKTSASIWMPAYANYFSQTID